MDRFLFAALLLACALTTSCGGSVPQNTAGVTPSVVPDLDSDGISDDWEQNGVDYVWKPDGSKRHLDMKQLGASTTHKDIFVWVAWMDAADHTHRPDDDAMNLVKDAFSRAAVSNPDGRPGISLHIVLAPSAIPEQPMLGGGSVDSYDWSGFNALKSTYFPAAFGNEVFFCLFGHNIDTEQHSGIAKTIPGRDFIISLAGFTRHVGGKYQQAGTFMHELGHALGLRHGGVDDIAYKPNYLSVMNYFFQMSGLTINGAPGNLRFSEFVLSARESALDGKVGMSTDPALSVYSSYHRCASDANNAVRIATVTGTPVDWKCDGTFAANVTADVNLDNEITDLPGASDWDKVVLRVGQSNSGIAAHSVTGLRPSDEMTAIDADRIPLFPVSDVHANQHGDGVVVQWHRIPLDRVLAYRVYRAVAGSAEEIVGTIDNVPSPSFVDLSPGKGRVSYSVSAVFAPNAVATTVPIDPIAPLPPFFHAITGVEELQGIRRHAPTQWGMFETTGVTATKENSVPKVFETERSSSVSIVLR